ncbi:unnamed protein product [Caenorhabditis nigoni]
MAQKSKTEFLFRLFQCEFQDAKQKEVRRGTDQRLHEFVETNHVLQIGQTHLKLFEAANILLEMYPFGILTSLVIAVRNNMKVFDETELSVHFPYRKKPETSVSTSETSSERDEQVGTSERVGGRDVSYDEIHVVLGRSGNSSRHCYEQSDLLESVEVLGQHLEDVIVTRIGGLRLRGIKIQSGTAPQATPPMPKIPPRAPTPPPTSVKNLPRIPKTKDQSIKQKMSWMRSVVAVMLDNNKEDFPRFRKENVEMKRKQEMEIRVDVSRNGQTGPNRGRKPKNASKEVRGNRRKEPILATEARRHSPSFPSLRPRRSDLCLHEPIPHGGSQAGNSSGY